MRTCDTHVQRHLPGRAVGYRPRVVVVRPVLDVVIVLAEVVNLVFGLDVAVLGGADVNADPAFVEGVEGQAGIDDRFLRAVDGDGAGAGAAAHFLFLLVAQLVEIADLGQDLAHVAGLELHDTADPVEEVLAKLGEGVA